VEEPEGVPTEEARTHVEALRRASREIERYLSRQDPVIISLICLGAIPLGFLALWIDQQTSTVRFVGFTGFIVLLALLGLAVPKLYGLFHLLGAWTFDRRLSRPGAVVNPGPPLLLALADITAETRWSLENLLSHNPSIAWMALRRENITRENLMTDDTIILGSKRHYLSRFFRPWPDFLRRLNADIRPGVWSTGEFGMLRDPGFLDRVEELSAGSITIIGWVEGASWPLARLLQELSKEAKEEQEPERRQIGPDEQKRITRLVGDGKLQILRAPHRLDEPHMAVLEGEEEEYVVVQQRHIHNRPALQIVLKKPTDRMQLFVRAHLEETKLWSEVSAIAAEEPR